MHTNNVAILLATYNGASHLFELLNSILAQTFSNWHIFTHDDGSSDSTIQILRRFELLHPEKISIIEDGLRCGSATQNFGHLLNNPDISAPYYMFCDQDDVWLPQKIEKSLAAAKHAERGCKPVLVYSDLYVVRYDLAPIADSMWDYQGIRSIVCSKFLLDNSASGCTMLFNHSMREAIGPITSDVFAHDWYCAQIASICGLVIRVDEPLILYRQHGSNGIGAKNYKWRSVIRRTLSSPISLAKHIYKLRTNIRRQVNAVTQRSQVFGIYDRTQYGLFEAFSKSNNWLAERVIILRSHALNSFSIKTIVQFFFL